MKEIQIEISEELNEKLEEILSNHPTFIIEAINEKLIRQNDEIINQEMAEGYLTTAEEDLEIIQAFEPSDLKDWHE